MANGGVDVTGLNEFMAAVDKLPDTVTSALKQIAKETAEHAKEIARQKLRSQQKTDAHALADNIVVKEDLKNKQYQVISEAPEGQARNVPIWNEYGTWKMSARPYMRPAEDEVADPYKEEMEAAAVKAVADAVGSD